MRSKLLIIDGQNFLWKAYGIPFKFHSKNGTPLHVITTFLSLTRRAIKIADSSGNCSIAIIFDQQEQTSNNRLSESYKANRKADYSQDKDSPFHHLPLVIKTLKYLGIKVYEKKGIEADDVIASLATQFLQKNKSGKVFVASSDSDFYQLLSKNISQIILGNKGTYILMTPKNLKQKLGLLPKDYVYFKSLTGDKADNIVGIPNVGPIRALKILKKELELDFNEYAKLIRLNQKLIGLNIKLKICKSFGMLVLNRKILNFKNQDIFQTLNF